MKYNISKEKIEIKVWNTCSKPGKTLIIASLFCSIDALTKELSGNHIHELLGINVANPNQLIEAIRNGIVYLGIGYGISKNWLEEKISPIEYRQKYGHLEKKV